MVNYEQTKQLVKITNWYIRENRERSELNTIAKQLLGEKKNWYSFVQIVKLAKKLPKNIKFLDVQKVKSQLITLSNMLHLLKRWKIRMSELETNELKNFNYDLNINLCQICRYFGETTTNIEIMGKCKKHLSFNFCSECKRIVRHNFICINCSSSDLKWKNKYLLQPIFLVLIYVLFARN